MAVITFESTITQPETTTERNWKLPHIELPAFIGRILTTHNLIERTQEVQEIIQTELAERRRSAELYAGYLGNKAVYYPAHGTDISEPAFDKILAYTEGDIVEASGMILQATADAQR